MIGKKSLLLFGALVLLLSCATCVAAQDLRLELSEDAREKIVHVGGPFVMEWGLYRNT